MCQIRDNAYLINETISSGETVLGLGRAVGEKGGVAHALQFTVSSSVSNSYTVSSSIWN